MQYVEYIYGNPRYRTRKNTNSVDENIRGTFKRDLKYATYFNYGKGLVLRNFMNSSNVTIFTL